MQIIMIRVQAVGLYVERVGNLRQHVHQFQYQINVIKNKSELKPEIRVKAQKNAYTIKA